MKLNEWIERWLFLYKRVSVRPSTFSAYLYDSRYLSTLDVDIFSFSVDDLQCLINKLAFDDNLSTSSIRHVVGLLRQALRKAISLGYCRHDVLSYFDFLEFPRDRKREIKAFSRLQRSAFISQCCDSFYGDFFRFLLGSGLRCGEGIALEWGDIDLFGHSLRVERIDYRGEIGFPKSASGRRMIPLSSFCMSILWKLRRGLDSNPGDHDIIFRSTSGNRINYRSLHKAFRRVLSLAGMEDFDGGLHVLRHSFATDMLRSGMNIKALSAILGHSDVGITMRIYCDVDFEDLSAAMELADERIRRLDSLACGRKIVEIGNK